MSLQSLSIDQGQRRVRSSPNCNRSFCHFWWYVVSDHWSNGHCSQILRRLSEWKNCWCLFKKHYLHEWIQVSDVYRCLFLLFALRRWMSPRIVGFFDILTVSNSALFKSFLLTMCMLAPESTTNSLSSSFMVDAAGKIHSSVGEKNVVCPYLWAYRYSSQDSMPCRGASLLYFSSDGPLFSQILVWCSALL